MPGRNLRLSIIAIYLLEQPRAAPGRNSMSDVYTDPPGICSMHSEASETLSIIFPGLCRADAIEFLLAVPGLTLPVCSFHQYRIYLYEIDAVLISSLWLNL